MIFTKFPKLIDFFTCWKKLAKEIFFFVPGHPHRLSYTHNDIFFSDSCIPVHGILFFLQTHVPGYMILCFFFKSMYPGTWNFDSSSNPCTPVHEIWILFHYLCVAQAVVVARCKKYFFSLPIFFNMLNFFSIFGIL